MIQLNWILKSLMNLSASELYAIMQLRNEVFVVEQNCVYQDADDKDQQAFTLLGWDDGKLVAYTRIIPPGISYTEASIGRVVTSPEYRGTGIGNALMEKSIQQCADQFNCPEIRIGAQVYLNKFLSIVGLCSKQ